MRFLVFVLGMHVVPRHDSFWVCRRNCTAFRGLAPASTPCRQLPECSRGNGGTSALALAILNDSQVNDDAVEDRQ